MVIQSPSARFDEFGNEHLNIPCGWHCDCVGEPCICNNCISGTSQRKWQVTFSGIDGSGSCSAIASIDGVPIIVGTDDNSGCYWEGTVGISGSVFSARIWLQRVDVGDLDSDRFWEVELRGPTAGGFSQCLMVKWVETPTTGRKDCCTTQNIPASDITDVGGAGYASPSGCPDESELGDLGCGNWNDATVTIEPYQDCPSSDCSGPAPTANLAAEPDCEPAEYRRGKPVVKKGRRPP